MYATAAPIGDDQETMLDGKKVPTFATFIRNTNPGSDAGVPGLGEPFLWVAHSYRACP